MENRKLSKELQDIEFALQQYSQKHGGDVIITVSVCAFDDDNQVVDDYMWFQGDQDCMKVSIEGLLEEVTGL